MRPPRPGTPALAALALLATLAACGAADPAPVTRVPVPVAGFAARGPADAWVTIVEYGDYQCPFCVREAPVLQALAAAYPADLRLVFKQFPLPLSIHPRAWPSAIAAVCAARQDLFWPYHDLLFAQAEGLSDAALQDYAAAAGLDLATWQACIASPEAEAAAQAQSEEGIGFGVRGTPTYFVNGVKYEGAGYMTTALVEAARADAMASGVARASYYDTVVLRH